MNDPYDDDGVNIPFGKEITSDAELLMPDT